MSHMKLNIIFFSLMCCLLISANAIAVKIELHDSVILLTQPKYLTNEVPLMNKRKIEIITKGNGRHWVGDGFSVNSMFSYNNALNLSPFLLLDYAEPVDFPPSDTPLGVDQHPHRGFETVTIVYHGELQHSDTAGNSGKIGPGDVQWMTAARGILHEEKHSDDFTRNGGKLEMVQLWVNLPAKYKMDDPHYQEISNSKIPVVSLEDEAGSLRVIAGSFAGMKSPAETYTPINIYDIRLKANKSLSIPVEDGFNAILLVLSGKVNIDDTLINSSELAVFATKGNTIEINSDSDATLLLMNGEAINEPVVGSGPFVMNTEDEIKQAFNDFRAGKLH